jgi:hypothetical protein
MIEWEGEKKIRHDYMINMMGRARGGRAEENKT